MKHVLLSAAVLSALLFTACSSEDPSGTETPDSSSGILKISATTAISNVGVSKRAVVSAFSATDYIGIFIDDAGTDAVYTPVSTVFTTANTGTSWSLSHQYISTAWTNSGTTPIYLSANQASVYGYYPTLEPGGTVPTFIIPNTENKTIPVTIKGGDATTNAGTFNASDQTDYMYAFGTTTLATTPAVATVDKDNAMASLTFMHALTEVSLTISKKVDFGGVGSLTNIELSTSSETYKFSAGTGSLNLSDGNLTTSSVDNLYFASSGGVAINEYGASSPTTTATLLLAPATIGAGGTPSVTLKLTIDGQVYEGLIPVTTIAQWEAGKNYTYTVTVGGGELSITSVAIAAWDPITGETIDVQ